MRNRIQIIKKQRDITFSTQPIGLSGINQLKLNINNLKDERTRYIQRVAGNAKSNIKPINKNTNISTNSRKKYNTTIIS